MESITLKVNGINHEITVGLTTNLLEVLRDKLHITSPKAGCENGDCGACSVIINGKLMRACITNALSIDGADVLTIEGLSADGGLHPLQKHFYEMNAFQCGFCTPGMIMAAKALLDRNANPSEQEIKEAMAGNICRCTGYVTIIDAVLAAAKELANKD